MATATCTTSTTSTTTTTVAREVVALDEATATAWERFREVRDLINTLDKEKEALAVVLREAVGEADAATVGGKVVLKVSRRERESFDATTLRDLFPEAWKAARRVKDFVVFLAA